MAERFLLSPLLIASFVAALAIGELASGTSPYFVTMMAIAVFSACVTYNILGGLGRIAGIGFTAMALSAIVVSQVGKVVLFEPADRNLDVPQLTITVYAVYFFSLMLGTSAFSRLRVPLPKPAEVDTPTRSAYLYAVALAGGLFGAFGVAGLDLAGTAAHASLAHGFARALAYLLPFSLVVAVDTRIRATHGRHSFGWMAVWPTLAMMLLGSVSAGRGAFMTPLVIIFVTCYVRDYRFGRRHFIAAVGMTAALFFFISPFFLWARGFRGGDETIGGEAATTLRALELAPAQWQAILYQVGESDLESSGAVSYFPTTGAVTLNRLITIGKDSTLINACSTGFHYGLRSLELDFATQMPSFLYPNKPLMGSNEYLGHLDGQESDQFETTNSTITPIADSYGAFSWLGVIVFPLLVVPAIFVVYESMFDISRPWGTVAVMVLASAPAGSMGLDIADTMIRTPIYILIISWCAAWCIRMIPATGDRETSPTRGYGPSVATAAGGGQPSRSAP
jgi:hypothetical protein